MLQFKVSGIIFVVKSLLYLDFGEILLQFKMTLYILKCTFFPVMAKLNFSNININSNSV